MRRNRTGRSPRCSTGGCRREAEESAMRLQLPEPDAPALVCVPDRGPARTGVCSRHCQGCLLARQAWKRAGSQVDGRRRPRTPEEQRDISQVLRMAREGPDPGPEGV